MKIKNHLIKIYFSISIIILIGFIISVYSLIDIKSELDKKDSGIIFSSIMKITPPLSGAFLSGLVALFIFSLTKRKEKEAKEKDSSAALEIINLELNENHKSIEKITDILNTGSSKNLAQMLIDPKDATKEKLSLLGPQLSIKTIDESIKKLSFDDYKTITTKVKYLNLVKNNFETLIKDLSSEEALEKSIDTLKEYCSKYKKLITSESTTPKNKNNKFKNFIVKFFNNNNEDIEFIHKIKLREAIFFILVIIILIFSK